MNAMEMKKELSYDASGLFVNKRLLTIAFAVVLFWILSLIIFSVMNSMWGASLGSFMHVFKLFDANAFVETYIGWAIELHQQSNPPKELYLPFLPIVASVLLILYGLIRYANPRKGILCQTKGDVDILPYTHKDISEMKMLAKTKKLPSSLQDFMDFMNESNQQNINTPLHRDKK